MEQYELLWQYQQVDMELDQYEKEMRGNSNRKELIKQVGSMAEQSKVSIRSIRRDAIEKFKAQKKKGEITEDDLKDMEKDVQELTEKYVKKIDDIAAKKEKELSEV